MCYVINTLLHYFYWILLNIIVYSTSVWPWSCQSRISLYIIAYYSILLNTPPQSDHDLAIAEDYWILLNVTEYYWILLYIIVYSDHDLAIAEYHGILLNIIEYYWILLNTPPQSNHDLAIAEDDCGERNHEPGQSRSFQRTLNWNI